MSTEVKKTNTVDSNDGALSKWGILALAVGANIGAGLITMLPVAIAETGHSVWVSFLIAIIVGSIIAIPCMMVCSAVVPPGGGYGMVGSYCWRYLQLSEYAELAGQRHLCDLSCSVYQLADSCGKC